MTEWRVELQGGDSELKALTLLFRTPELRVIGPRDGAALMSASEFQTLSTAHDVWKRAVTLVTRMNATGVLKFGRFEPVAVVRVLSWVEGQQQGYAQNWSKLALPNQTLEAFVEWTPNRPTVEGDPAAEGAPDRFPKVEDWVVGLNDTDVDTVCDLLVRHSNDWRVLTFIYEIIEGQIGQGSKMEKRGWATVREIRLFIDTANNPDAIGTAARHGRATRPVPPKPMALPEAQSLIVRIVTAWLRWKRTGK